jgi:hypothetical protein
MEAVLSVILGIGLAAACGFRIFIPPLIMSIAAMSGHLHLAEGFEWMGTWPALVAFAVATVLEIVAYYVPWLDNALDAVATPSAVVAGVIVAASCVQDMSPLLKWSLAVVAGGGVAAVVQLLTVKARALSSGLTMGFANWAVSTAESAGSLLLSVITVVLPIVTAVLVVLFISLAWLILHKKRGGAPRLEKAKG